MLIEHVPSTGAAVMEEEEKEGGAFVFLLYGRGGGQQASSLVAKQAVEFPQVLASIYYSSIRFQVAAGHISQIAD